MRGAIVLPGNEGKDVMRLYICGGGMNPTFGDQNSMQENNGMSVTMKCNIPILLLIGFIGLKMKSFC